MPYIFSSLELTGLHLTNVWLEFSLGAICIENVDIKQASRVVEAHFGVAIQIRVTGHITLHRTQFNPISARADPSPTILRFIQIAEITSRC